MTEILTENVENIDEPMLVEGFTEGEKHFYIRGKFATIEARNNNKRVYPRYLWEREVAKYQDEIKNGTINTLMEWDHPKDRLAVDPSKAVAKITKLWIEGEYVMGEAVIFDVPMAETIKNMIKHGVRISVSSRSAGRCNPAGIVQEMRLVTFDLVANPSDQAAYMYGIYESNQSYEDALMQIETENNDALYESLVRQIRSRDAEIADLTTEIQLLKEGRFEEENVEYTLRRAGEELTQTHRHQDVATLVDTDKGAAAAEGFASGETEALKIARLVVSLLGRDDTIGAVLDKDVDTKGIEGKDQLDGKSADVEEEVRQAETGKEAEKVIAEAEVAEAEVAEAEVAEADAAEPALDGSLTVEEAEILAKAKEIQARLDARTTVDGTDGSVEQAKETLHADDAKPLTEADIEAGAREELEEVEALVESVKVSKFASVLKVPSHML